MKFFYKSDHAKFFFQKLKGYRYNHLCIRNIHSAKALKNYKIMDEVKIFWRLVAVGNGILWLTPCKRMKLRRSE